MDHLVRLDLIGQRHNCDNGCFLNASNVML